MWLVMHYDGKETIGEYLNEVDLFKIKINATKEVRVKLDFISYFFFVFLEEFWKASSRGL